MRRTAPRRRRLGRLAVLTAASLGLLGLLGGTGVAAPTAGAAAPAQVGGVHTATVGWVYWNWYPHDGFSCSVNGWFHFGQAGIPYQCVDGHNGRDYLYFWAD